MSVDWQAMFSPEHSLIEIFLRGTIMYIVLFSILLFHEAAIRSDWDC
jgi:hypothetical protein